MPRRSKETTTIEDNGFTEAERTKLMLWGDAKLGVRGIKGRVDRIERMGLAIIAGNAVSFLILLGHLEFSFTGSGGIIGSIIKALFGG